VIDGRIGGVEALVRWNHPERGLLTPASFLAVAEESALMIELGDWVMDAALRDMKRWRDAGLDIGKLAVNFSFRQIEQADFVDKVISALKLFSYPAQAFEIEITESALMSDPANTIDKLQLLHSYGVSIAIDDFGTGYSSLSLLQKLPLNRLKIDRSFIQDLQTDSDRSIIEAIAHMAKGLKLDMVAEGVEQDYQLRYLRKLQCQVVQGFIYSQCLAEGAMRKLLEERAVMTVRSNRILHSV
jgi:EAL domain-containing protein (putative c-di-GMP-specific phosphodiesterase class I)